jgi:hypothetical protein
VNEAKHCVVPAPHDADEIVMPADPAATNVAGISAVFELTVDRRRLPTPPTVNG